MIQMRVTQSEALRLISQIPHSRCQRSVESCWIEDGAAGVTAQSICWLYCWAKTGMNSIEAAHQAQRVFSQIFDHPYEWFSARVPHEWARRVRYMHRNIEPELMALLAG